MTKDAQSMTNRALSGLFWLSLATAANVLLLLLVMVILARLLTPADFGLAAVALMVIGFSAIFSEFGIGPAVVQRLDLRPVHLRVGFTLSLLLGVLFGVVVWLSAPAVAGFFRLDELTPILRVLALLFPVQGLAVVADSLLQRELRFRVLAALEVVAVVLGYGFAGITLAVLGFGAWALVGAHLVQTIVKTILVLFLRPHPAWPLLQPRACAELLFFGGGYSASRFCNYLAGQAENVVIGRCLGAVALGVYGRAYQLMAGPAVLFGNILDRVLFPAMVQVQDQPERLAYAYRRGIALIALVILPTSAVLVLLAREVTLVLLGPDWERVILPLQILGVGMLFRTGCKISDSLVRATGAVYRRTWRQAAYAVLVVAGAWVGQHWDVAGVAVAVLVTLAVNFFLMAHLSLRLVAMSWRTFTAAHLPGVALAALVGVPVGVAAELLRARGFSPALVLFLSLPAILPFLLGVVCLPRVFLGQDGRWMVRKLMTFLPSREKSPARPDRLPSAPPGEPAPHAGNGAAVPLAGEGDLLHLLMERLSSAEVRYGRWKSPLDMRRILSGKGDLDLLVAGADGAAFLGVAEGLGFKRAVGCFAPEGGQELHLYGLNPETGALLHVHVSFTLLGEEFASPDTVPSLEEFVLRHCIAGKVPGPLEGMPVVQPRAELIVHVLRTMEQYSRLREYPRLAAKRDVLHARLQTLLNAGAEEDWHALLALWLPAVPPALFAECLAALRWPSSWLRRFRLARRLRRQMRGGRPRLLQGRLRGVASQMRGLLHKIWWRLGHGPGSPKQLPSGGGVIAFVGPDASGKSTMVAETTRWLGTVFRARAAHLGKPPSTWLTLLPNLAARLLRRLTPHLRPSVTHGLKESNTSGGQGLLYCLRAVLLAWDRRAFARRLARKAARGWFIVCDRYPSAFVGAADSARLRAPAAGARLRWLKACLARLENRLYRDVPPPDMVFRLTAPLDLAIGRNRDREKAGKESDDYVARRHKHFIVPQFANVRAVEVDTTQPQAVVLRQLRRLVWERLGGPAGAGNPSCLPLPGSRPFRTPLIVEFIGATGVGKSTLLRAVAECLSDQGIRVGEAESVILTRYGWGSPRNPKARSALVHLLALRPYFCFLCSRQGASLSRLALVSIARGMGNLWTGMSLLRNFWKRIGAHLLLEGLRDGPFAGEIVLCDEGVVHAAHNLFVHTSWEPGKEEIVQFGRVVPKPDLLIWVTAPTRQSAEVILRRGHSRVSGPSATALAFAEQAHVTFEVLSAVEELRPLIYRVENTARGPEQNGAAIRARAAAVAAFLRQRLRQPPGPAPRAGTLASPLPPNVRTP